MDVCADALSFSVAAAGKSSMPSESLMMSWPIRPKRIPCQYPREPPFWAFTGLPGKAATWLPPGAALTGNAIAIG